MGLHELFRRAVRCGRGGCALGGISGIGGFSGFDVLELRGGIRGGLLGCMRPRGLMAMISELSKISTGAANSKTLGSSLSNRNAPATPPNAPMTTYVMERTTWPLSSLRAPITPPMPVPTTPTVLEAFANTGGMPNASKAGYETSDDAPTA